MGHRINVWIQRMLIPIGVVVAIIMRHLGFGVWRMLAVLLPILGLLMLVTILVDPGPRAKELAEGLKSRFR
ncbi:MAG: hypothetical protein WA254_23320 [Candidatus Sulfotelmatobacter sp.]